MDFSRYGGHFPSALAATVPLASIERSVSTIRYLSIAEFEAQFQCKINSLPQNVCLCGWRGKGNGWFVAPASLNDARSNPASALFQRRSSQQLLKLLREEIIDPLGLQSFWFTYCFYDGWRERNTYSSTYFSVMPDDLSAQPEWSGMPGAIPILSPSRQWIACFGAHRHDPSALLLPDPHYLRDLYVSMFREVEQARMPWQSKLDRAVFAAGDHGDHRNFFVPPLDVTLHPRRLIKRIVDEQQLNVDAHLGQFVSRADQMRYRYILDVDGFARTWDAWAWKVMSGSVVLSVDSPWDSFFSVQFRPWEHFVPVANDGHDLSEKLEWCAANDNECERIADRAMNRAIEVYDVKNVVRTLRLSIEQRLKDPLTI
jgi:hypothetical protein